ncbi:MAG: hypothetical protein HFE76_16520 [Firmicutes bacterium]|nr:hypothetical protein [Bacillota bacterium]
MKKLSKSGSGQKALSLLLAACLTITTLAVPAAYAGEASPPVEKSHSQNHSQSKETKDIQAAKKTSPGKSLPTSAGGKRSGKAKAASNSFDIHIAGEYHQAKAYEMLGYANRNRDYTHQLKWDSELEALAMTRAAELPIYYSGETRPNGEENYATYIAVNYESAYELYQALYRDYSYEGYFDGSAYTHFAAAAFKADNDSTYWAVIFHNERLGNTNPINQNYEDDNVYVNVADQYLDWEACFLNSSKNDCSEKNLTKGKTYYAWIDVYNYNSERYYDDDPILIQTQEASSNNTSVLTIDRWGTIQTKKAGAATVKVSPSEDSGYETTYYCTVRGAAATPNSKAHKAYVNQIKKDKKKYCSGEKLQYAYKDLNGDGIDELITYPGFGYCMEILYTYTNGKVKKLKELGQREFEKYYLKNKVLRSSGGHMDHYDTTYYKFQGSRLVKKAYQTETISIKKGNPVVTHKYYINGKKVSKSKYKAYVKKLTKGDKAKSFSKLNWKKY